MISYNNRYVFEPTRGDTFTLCILFKTLHFNENGFLRSTIRRDEDSKESVSTFLNLVKGANGPYTLSFNHEKTKDLHGRYVIDVEVSDYDKKKVSTILMGTLIVNKDVTH